MGGGSSECVHYRVFLPQRPLLHPASRIRGSSGGRREGGRNINEVERREDSAQIIMNTSGWRITHSRKSRKLDSTCWSRNWVESGVH